jgi:hypothetical protein
MMAISKDDGESWSFIDGSVECISSIPVKAIQKLDIKSPTLEIGDKKLIQKNGQWVKASE